MRPEQPSDYNTYAIQADNMKQLPFIPYMQEVLYKTSCIQFKERYGIIDYVQHYASRYGDFIKRCEKSGAIINDFDRQQVKFYHEFFLASSHLTLFLLDSRTLNQTLDAYTLYQELMQNLIAYASEITNTKR